MPARHSTAKWTGGLKDGSGTMKLGGGAWEGSYSFPSRFEDGTGTNPEELLGASHAGCFSMAFGHGLAQAGFTPRRIQTHAKVHLGKVEGGFAITRIDLESEADVPGIDEATFQEQAEAAKKGCPVSKALSGVDIRLQARLL